MLREKAFQKRNDYYYQFGLYLKLSFLKKPKLASNLSHAEVLSLYRSLLSGQYKFSRMRRIFIPKAPGKVGLRPITIPNCRDLPVLYALKLLLHSVLEPTLSLSIHGFISRRGSFTLFEELLSWREVDHIVILDILKCFDSIIQSELKSTLSRAGVRPNVLSLIASYLTCEIRDDSGTDYTLSSGIGLLQGGSISPILMNMYLSELDSFFDSVRYLRYADDIIIGLSHREPFPDFSRLAERLGLTITQSSNSKKGGLFLGVLVFSCSNGQISTSLDFSYLKRRWDARLPSLCSHLFTLGGVERIKHLRSLICGLCLYYGPLVTRDRLRVIKFIRKYYMSLALSVLKYSYSYQDVVSVCIPSVKCLMKSIRQLCRKYPTINDRK